MRASILPGAVAVLLCLTLSGAPADAQQAPQAGQAVFLNEASRSAETEARIEALRGVARRQGSIDIIVGIDAPIAPPEVVGAASHKAQKATFREAASALASRVYGGRPSGRSFRPFDVIPYAVMRVDAAQLDAVLSDPAVTNVQLNAPAKLAPRLEEVREIIDADYLWKRKRVRKGKGQTIAVLDSGLDRNLPSFAGRIAHEACFSESSPECVSDEEGNKDFESKGPGAAWECRKSAQIQAKKNKKLVKKGKDPEYCSRHGTEVASVALARAAKIREGVTSLDGLAPKADLVAVRITNSGATYASIAKGIEYVYKKRKTYGITAATMSVGLLDFRDNRECSGRLPSLEASIDLLLGAGIPFFNSSGNDSSNAIIDYPSCVDTVVSVGASKENDKKIAPFSDTNHLVDMLVPGDKTCLNEVACLNGTSFAAPAAAGSYVLMKAANRKKGAEEIVTAMHCTGKFLTRDDSDTAVPRLDLKAAHRFLNKKKPAMRWDFDDAEDALGWYEMWGDWQVAGDSYTIGPDNEIWVSFVLNELCFDEFKFEARIRNDGDVHPGRGLVLFEEPKQTGDSPPYRTFNGFYWLLYDTGYSRFLAITDNQFNVDPYTPKSGESDLKCEGSSDVVEGEFVTQTLQLKNGRIKIYVNGEHICDVDVDDDVEYRSYGVFALRRNLSDASAGTTYVDYVKIKGL